MEVGEEGETLVSDSDRQLLEWDGVAVKIVLVRGLKGGMHEFVSFVIYCASNLSTRANIVIGLLYTCLPLVSEEYVRCHVGPLDPNIACRLSDLRCRGIQGICPWVKAAVCVSNLVSVLAVISDVLRRTIWSVRPPTLGVGTPSSRFFFRGRFSLSRPNFQILS